MRPEQIWEEGMAVGISSAQGEGKDKGWGARHVRNEKGSENPKKLQHNLRKTSRAGQGTGWSKRTQRRDFAHPV